MKKVLAGILALGSLSFSGCGPTVEDVIGTWTWAEGSGFTVLCDGYDPIMTDIAGTTMTFVAGTEHNLILESGDCDGVYYIDGSVLKFDGTQGTCDTEEDDVSSTFEGEIILTYTEEGYLATLTPSGELKSTLTFEDGVSTVCLISYDAGSKATK